METKSILGENEVATMLRAGVDYARSKNWIVTIAVTDPGGYLIGLRRMDKCQAMASLVAHQKARTAALSGKETKVFEDMINNGRGAFITAPLEGCMEGGIPLLENGHVIGAIGVSGMAKNEDREIAQAAIDALKNA